MNTINAVNLLDGNQYQVSNDTTTNQVTSDFDTIYQSESEDQTLDDIFHKVSQEYGVDESLLKAVAQTESGFDTNAVSGCGAMGIMQLMPTTAESLGVEDPFDAEQSITGGAKMLAYLLDDYNGNVTLALAAYNAGSGSVSKYGGVPPYKETVNYISKINDILGGALSNDSTTVAGATATSLSGVSSEKAPDVAIKGDQSTTYDQTGSLTAGTGNLYQIVNKNELSVNNGLLSYEDYQYFLNTYQQVFDELTENADVNSTSTADSILSQLDSQTQTEVTIDTDTDSSVVSSDTEDTSSLLKYNANIASAAMSQNTSYEGLLKTNPQSLYEAQASVMSPIISQLYNS